MIRLVLFDIDGTLIRTGGAGVQAFRRAFESEFGIVDGARGLDFAGRTDPSIVRDGFEQHGIEGTDENLDRFFKAYLDWLGRLLPTLRGGTCSGVLELLAGIQSADAPPVIGLLTGNVRRGAEMKLAHYDLWHHFELGAFGNDHEDRNELARIAQGRAADHLGQAVPGHEILIIGDTPRDIACAAAIQARVLAVATGRHSVPELSAFNPTWVFEKLDAVRAEEILAG